MLIYIRVYVCAYMVFPSGSDRNKSACNARDPGSIPGSGRSPEEGNGNPLQNSCLEKSMERQAWGLVGYSPWSHKESDMTERLTLTELFVYICVCLCVSLCRVCVYVCLCIYMFI